MNVYYNSLVNCQFIFKDGKVANFLGGRYLTNTPKEVEELDAEVALGHPHIYVKSEELTIDTTFVDPMDAIREKVRKEVLAEMAATTSKDNDRGNYDVSDKLQGIGNTNTIAEGASGSVSTDAAPVQATTIASPALVALQAKIVAGKAS